MILKSKIFTKNISNEKYRIKNNEESPKNLK